MKTLEQIQINLRHKDGQLLPIYIDVYDNSLSCKWLSALSRIIDKKYLLEKHYCFLGFEQNCRNAKFLIDQINYSIEQINLADLGYQINDYFTLENSLVEGPIEPEQPGQRPNQDHFNNLHRYFEDLQGTSGNISPYYNKANSTTRYHIRQLNLLCHEFETWNLIYKFFC